MHLLSVNAASSKARYEKLDGRKFIVVPMTMIVPGVLPGSKGPLLYPPDEVERSTADWNGMPIVTPTHPLVNGVHVSARRPDVIDKFGVGWVFNSKFADKLTAEGWYDIDKTSRVERKLLTDLESGHAAELSTGLFTVDTPVPAGMTYNGVGYDAIARNYRPDHLAALVGEAGACSVKDGCGINVNSCECEKCKKRRTRKLTYNAFVRGVKELLRTKAPAADPVPILGGATVPKAELVNWLVTNCACWKGEGDRAILEGLPEPKLEELKKDAEKATTNANPVSPPAPPPPPPPPPPTVPSTPTVPKVNSVQEFEASMPAEARVVWDHAKSVVARDKQIMVDRLTANMAGEAKTRAAAIYGAMGPKELSELVAALPVANTNVKPATGNPLDDLFPVDYGAAAGLPGQTTNAVKQFTAEEDAADVLRIPTMNFDKKEKSA